MASARLLPGRPFPPGRTSEREAGTSPAAQVLQPFPRARKVCVRANTSFSSAEPLALGPRPDLPSAFEDASRAQSAGPPPNPPLFREELEKLLRLLPKEVSRKLLQHPDVASLVEIVLDLGRVPIARFASGDWVISDEPVSAQDLELTVSQVGSFGGDNRAGVDRTLHRISAIRNRAGKVVGLTCRVGRAIAGGAEMVRDLVAQGGSMLILGPPGVGKTTAIRDVARLLADEYGKRVVVVDTSNEIGGDGDVPHAGIGGARRMQVPQVDRQHEIMIEAVENHMPQAIVIDEIGTELEATAACTIAQRGVQLVGTAHGMTVDNLVKNPSLQDLAGGIQSVTLGDEEARRRGVQKSVLERKGPPVFDCAVEMLSRTTWRVHRNLAATVDSLLAGKTPVVEIRSLTPGGQVAKTGARPLGLEDALELSGPGVYPGAGGGYSSAEDEDSDSDSELGGPGGPYNLFHATQQRPLMLYLYQGDWLYQMRRGGWVSEDDAGRPQSRTPLTATEQPMVSLDSLEQVVEVMGVQQVVDITTDVGAADAVLALRSKLKQNAWLRGIAKFRQLPIYAIKSNTMPQMVRAMRAILGFDSFGPGLKARWVSPTEDPLSLSGPSDVPLMGGLGPGGAIAGLAQDPNGSEIFGLGALRSQAGAGAGAGAGGEAGAGAGPGGGAGGRALGLAGLASLTARAEEEEAAADDWLAVGNRASLEDEIDALEEARLAVEQIVLPLSSPVELLPRSPHVLDLQTKLLRRYCLEAERVGAHPSCRIRILPLSSSQSRAAPPAGAAVSDKAVPAPEGLNPARSKPSGGSGGGGLDLTTGRASGEGERGAAEGHEAAAGSMPQPSDFGSALPGLSLVAEPGPAPGTQLLDGPRSAGVPLTRFDVGAAEDPEYRLPWRQGPNSAADTAATTGVLGDFPMLGRQARGEGGQAGVSGSKSATGSEGGLIGEPPSGAGVKGVVGAVGEPQPAQGAGASLSGSVGRVSRGGPSGVTLDKLPLLEDA